MLTQAAAEIQVPAARVVSDVPLPPMPTLADLQSGGRSRAAEQPARRIMSLNSKILAAQRDWEQKRRDSGGVKDGASGESDYPTESDGTESDDSGSHIDVHAVEDSDGTCEV